MSARDLPEASKRPAPGLPALTPGRRRFRKGLRWLANLLVRCTLRIQIFGLEHFPRRRPCLVVSNHLGDMEVLLGLAFLPVYIDPVAKAELRNMPLLGWVMDRYGVIWVQRGQPDRVALAAARQALEQGRWVGIAPEGHESATGSLETGLGGAAYLAIKANVPLVPVVFTRTENRRVYGNLRRLRRTKVTMTVGPPWHLETEGPLRQRVRRGTERIMIRLARLLPPEYRGVYRGRLAAYDGRE